MVQGENSYTMADVHYDNDVLSIATENFIDLVLETVKKLENHDNIVIKMDKHTWTRFESMLPNLWSITHFSHNDRLQFPLDTPPLPSDEVDAVEQYTHRMHVMMDGYYHLNEKKYLQLSFAQWVHHYTVKKKKQSAINFNQRFISFDEYLEKKQLIERAVECATQSEERVREKMEFNKLKAHINAEEILPLLHINIDKLSVAFEKMDHELNVMGKLWKKQAYDKFNKVYNLYLQLHRETMQYNDKLQGNAPKKPGIFSFSKENKINFDRFENLQKNCLELEALHKAIIDPAYQSQGVNHMDDIHRTLSNINHTLATWPSMVTHNIGLKLSRITTLSTQNDRLVQCANAVNEVINELNHANIWTQQIEFNSNVVEKYIEEIPRLMLRCKIAINSLENDGGSMDWIGFVNSLDSRQKTFIARFKELPVEQWLEAFDDYFREPLLHALHHPNVIRDQENAKAIYASYHLLNESKEIKAYNKMLGTIKSRFRSLNNQWPKVAKMISKNKSGLMKQDYFKEDLAHMTALFPLTIQLVESKKGVLQMDVIAESSKSYHFLLNEDQAFHSMQEVANRNMENIPPTEKYGVASILANALLQYCKDFSIMQLKNANILCLWPDEMSAWLVEKLDTSGVKLFKAKGREKDALIECIIESGRRPILLTMDGLINSHQPEEIIHQYQLMEAFVKIGYQVINVWTADMLDNSEQLMTSLKHKLIND